MRCDNRTTMLGVKEIALLKSQWIYWYSRAATLGVDEMPLLLHEVEHLHQVRKKFLSSNQYHWHVVTCHFNPKLQKQHYLIPRSTRYSITRIWTSRTNGRHQDQTVVLGRVILNDVFLSLLEMPVCYLKLGHNRFLPRSPKLIIYQSSDLLWNK
jgi:hypothetical protein